MELGLNHRDVKLYTWNYTAVVVQVVGVTTQALAMLVEEVVEVQWLEEYFLLIPYQLPLLLMLLIPLLGAQ